MVDFIKYRAEREAEQAKAELAYEQELRRKPINELTPKEIGVLYDLNENFCGKDVDTDKLRRYAALKDAVTDLMSVCAEAHQITESEPVREERNATIRLDVKAITTMNKAEAGLLAEALKLADFVVVSLVDDFIRYSFSVENIWKA
jgi:type VI protein secretion system component VasF